MRGGTSARRPGGVRVAGLSPRARGNRPTFLIAIIRTRSIPACAGDPVTLFFRAEAVRVYPRVRGGTRLPARWLLRQAGLSPRARGNLEEPLEDGTRNRSIPACAGEPAENRRPCLPGRVYPRVRGGTGRSRQRRWPWRGLSPRARGNLTGCCRTASRSGSIPACAGEPLAELCQHTHRQGLSPRARGNPSPPCAQLARSWSIPACAGEPVEESSLSPRKGVYPRVRGGTSSTRWQALGEAGLSPRARGNLPVFYPPVHAQGSIPACAGEPNSLVQNSSEARVYPRVRGGTSYEADQRIRNPGLSPRARGNLDGIYGFAMRAGSIPACAGEPCCACGSN